MPKIPTISVEGSSSPSGSDQPPPFTETPNGLELKVASLAAEKLLELLDCSGDSILSEVKVVDFQATVFSSSALGCPKPNLIYSTVMTPGYVVAMQYNGSCYAVHTN